MEIKNSYIPLGWYIVGAKADNTLIVRGGENPIAIKVIHNDSENLFDLVRDANAGIKNLQSQRNDFKNWLSRAIL